MTNGPMDTRNCGNCGWSELLDEQEHQVTAGPNRVACIWLVDSHNRLPISIHESITFMYAHEGYGCKCWKAKGA